jgi:TM2 domain-containing membrane protein YozV
MDELLGLALIVIIIIFAWPFLLFCFLIFGLILFPVVVVAVIKESLTSAKTDPGAAEQCEKRLLEFKLAESRKKALDCAWYYAADAEQKGPVNESELKANFAAAKLPADTLVWKDGMDNWAPANQVAAFYFHTPTAPTPKSKRDAVILAVFLGWIGVHKLYLGYHKAAIIMMAVTVLTCGYGMWITVIIGLIEGLIYATKTDENFARTYLTGKREWF